MSRKTIALVVGLLLLTVLLVAIAMQTARPTTTTPPQDTTEQTPSPALEAKTRLFMSPNQVTLSGNTANITVMMDAQDNPVTAVQLEISYDPKVLSFVSVTPSGAFAEGVPLLNTIDRRNGRISYAIGLSPQQAASALTGESEVASLVFNRVGSASDSASTEVTFLPKSLVSATGISQSVLKESTGATVLLSQ